ncbi:hypothetical protein JRQ81_005605 [Phrynocephalus forsythii]|uniref:ZP domain-containing protein n=1 Tax=Phrynocephalus forsythii TaxID=171643 RepID=A0A9Q1B6U8_9SAUR|nr:hypothetical protein JRQ81_005605 [Phrynocephalus forsythii]
MWSVVPAPGSMEVLPGWLCRILVFFSLLQSGAGRTGPVLAPPGFIQTACFSSMFWMRLEESFLKNKFHRIEIIDPSGTPVVLDRELGARCGYILSKDVWGNTIFRASLLACHVTNERDETFSLAVNIQVSAFEDMRAPAIYPHLMRCSYSPWAPREIVCEENYMEVSVKTDIPVISDDEAAPWMSALPETQKVAYQVWQLIFHSPSGRKTTVVSDAGKLGYSFNNTLSRVFLRSPYTTNESEHSVVNGVTMSTVSSTSMYKQRWLLLLIDTTVSCPVDGTIFTDVDIIWMVPTIIPRLVLQEPSFTSLNISMGVGEKRIEEPEKLNYTLERNLTHIGITIPIGADGGRFESTVSHGVYGITYSINVFLEHAWTDTDWKLTKYTVIKPITTPFLPRIPTVVNDTDPQTRLFNVTLGAFLSDVTLVAVTIGNVPLSLKEAGQKGYKITDIPNADGKKSFRLEVPFDDPNVLREYVNKNETKYSLHVTYTLNVGPKGKVYHHPADIECTIADVVLPEAIGYCGKKNMYFIISVEVMDHHWRLYVGNMPLSPATALANGYLLTTNGTHQILQVPPFAVGIIYEEVSFERLQARFDLVLKKTLTMETLETFSVRCSFRSTEFVVCYPNGTVSVSAAMKTLPVIDMSKTRLKDRTCKPKEFTKDQAFFQFHVSTCGTSLRFEGERLVYENEISFEKESLPVQGPPIITRDPDYRLTILCYYPVKETLTQSAKFYAFSSPPPSSVYGYGAMTTRSATAGLRRARQALNIVSNMFKDESFAATYGTRSAVVTYPWKHIFLEVELQDESAEVELYLDNCWMTESERFSSFPRWNLIVDGQVVLYDSLSLSSSNMEQQNQSRSPVNRCEHPSNGTVSFFPVTANERVKYPNHFKRVIIQMRALPLRKVYLHCTATVSTCLHVPSNGFRYKQCTPGRTLGQHSAIHPTCYGYTVTGPIFILHPEKGDQH